MSLPVVDPPAQEDRTGEAGDATPVAGVVLAAGEGSRFDGGNKLLARVEGEPVVRRAVETMLDSTLDGVTVVVGHEADEVRDGLDGLAIDIVENPDYASGQATSVRAGVTAVRDRAGAVVVHLGDMPFVDPASVDALVASYRAGHGGALASACEGQRGNPVLFDSGYFDALADVEGDVGGRRLVRRDGVLVETGDPGVVHDVDRPRDLDAEGL